MSSHSVAPLVSIIMPNYNGGKYVGEAIESALNQTYTNWELIIIDDGSTDNSVAVIQKYAAQDERIKLLINAANKGLPTTRNRAFKVFKGEFVCFLDSDDIFLPEKLADQVTYLTDHKDTDLVFSNQLVGDGNMNIIDRSDYFVPSIDIKEFLSIRNIFSPISVMLRRRLIEKVGDFDTTFNGMDDWEYWIRCSEKTVFHHLKKDVAIYRVHSSQMHHNIKKMKDGRALVIKKHFKEGKVRRLALGAHYWTWARMSKYHKNYGLTFWYLLQMFYHARTIKNLKTIFSEYNK